MPITRHPLMPHGPDDRRLHHIGVDPSAYQRLNASLGLLRDKGPRIVGTFYSRLFERYPGVRPMFPTDMASQQNKLLGSLVMVVEHLRDPEQVTATLQELGRKHEGYGALPEHYPIVCSLLLESMATELGTAWNDQLESEWSQALTLVSQIMIDACRPPGGSTSAKTRS